MEKHHQKAALLEFSTGHVECLYSQASFLKDAGYEVHLICPMACRERVSVYDKVDVFHFLPESRSNRGHLKQALRIGRILKTHTVRLLVINTFMGKEILWLLPFTRRVRMACVLHWLGKLKRSVSLRIIRMKIRRFFVLSDHLLEQIPKKQRTRFQAFYPIFLPEFKRITLSKPEEELWICMPGNIEYRRRNYPLLLKHLDDSLDKRVRFILLGDLLHPSGDGLDFRRRLERNGWADRFVTFEGSIPDPVFQSHVKHSDLIMPLLRGRPRYLTSAVSGAFNLAFYYKIPMLIEEEFAEIEDLANSSIVIRPEDLTAVLNRLVVDRDPLRNRIRSIKENPKFSYDVQYKRYVDFLKSPPTIRDDNM